MTAQPTSVANGVASLYAVPVVATMAVQRRAHGGASGGGGGGGGGGDNNNDDLGELPVPKFGESAAHGTTPTGPPIKRPQFTLVGLILPILLPHFFASIAKEVVVPVLPNFASQELGAAKSLIGVAIASLGLAKVGV